MRPGMTNPKPYPRPSVASGRHTSNRRSTAVTARSIRITKADMFELPAMGIKGNTHMMMMDRNSDQIAGLINDWLVKQGLMN